MLSSVLILSRLNRINRTSLCKFLSFRANAFHTTSKLSIISLNLSSREVKPVPLLNMTSATPSSGEIFAEFFLSRSSRSKVWWKRAWVGNSFSPFGHTLHSLPPHFGSTRPRKEKLSENLTARGRSGCHV